jgi:hypothetical protein
MSHPGIVNCSHWRMPETEKNVVSESDSRLADSFVSCDGAELAEYEIEK